MCNKKDKKVSLFLNILAAACLMLAIPLVSHAVTKSLSIVGENGQALSGTTITITFQDGTEAEEDTDDKGLLVFNFKKKGTYTLSDPQGNVVKTVNITGMDSRKKWEIAAIAAGAALLLASGSNSDNKSDSETDSGTGDGTGDGAEGSTESDPGTSTPAVDDTPSVNLAGNYNVNCSVASNPGSHPDLIPQNTAVEVKIQGSNITFYEMGMNGTHDGTNFVATKTADYAGYSTSFVFEGSQNTATGQISGTLTIGGDGKLPGGQAIVYSCTGTPI